LHGTPGVKKSAVAAAMRVSMFSEALWLQPCAFQCSKKCCGYSHARFNFLRSAVAAARGASVLSTALWLQPCASNVFKSAVDAGTRFAVFCKTLWLQLCAFQCSEKSCGCSHARCNVLRSAVEAAMRVSMF